MVIDIGSRARAQPVERLESSSITAARAPRTAIEEHRRVSTASAARPRASAAPPERSSAGERQRLLQPREGREDASLVPRRPVAGAALEAPELEVVRDRHAGEEPAALRHVRDAAARDLRGGPACELFPRERDRPGRGRRDADDALQQSRLPGAVASQQRHDLALAHVEAHVAQDVALAVEVLTRSATTSPLARRARQLAPASAAWPARFNLLHRGESRASARAVPDTVPSFSPDVVGEREHSAMRARPAAPACRASSP